VGDEAFACGKEFEGGGSAKTTVQPLDLRFFVHDVALIREDSTEVPLTLTARHPWQSAKVALLDFEDMTGKCKGNPSTNDQVTGTLPAGDYEGVAFTIGVPASENHGDPFELGAPLTAGGMSWSWLSGFKFLKVELEQVLEPSGAGGDAPAAGLGLLHIGSTGCSGDPAKGTVTCGKANRSRVKLTGFDPTQGTITANIGKLFAETDLSQVSQCHSMQGPTCTPMFAAAGLVFGTGAQAEQSVFSAK
jgi:uncharacterized repeat protein (TIGR04052 family)